jgi:hypothetical protein
VTSKPTRSDQERPESHAPESAERPRPQPWRNTRPPGNPEPDKRDLERSVERLEMLLGR